MHDMKPTADETAAQTVEQPVAQTAAQTVAQPVDRAAPATSDEGGTAAAGAPNTILWWHIATAIDILHMPIVIALVVLGAIYFSGPVFVFLLTLMVVLQVAVLGCPVMWLTGQLRKVHDPDYQVQWSFTAWLYHRYGRWVGIGVFVSLAVLTLALKVAWF